MDIQKTIFDLVRDSDKEVVEPIDRCIAKPFIESIHYSRKYPSNIVYAFGLYKGEELEGVVTYGIPASPSLCVGLAGKENRNKVLELNRLAIRPDLNGGNKASFLVSHSLKMLPNETYVVSYADTGWTHVGYVYQACNFLYTGLSVKRVDTYQPEGKHPRHRKNLDANIHQTRNQKHRYVYLVGDKRTKKKMRKALKYKVYDKYPKGDEIHYDTSNPRIAIPIQIIDEKGSNHEQNVNA